MNWKKQIQKDCADRLTRDTPAIAAYEAIPLATKPPMKMRFVLPLSAFGGLAAITVVLFVTLRSLNRGASKTPSAGTGSNTYSTAIFSSTSSGTTGETGTSDGTPTSVSQPSTWAYQVGVMPYGNSKGEAIDFKTVSLSGTSLTLDGTIVLSHSLVASDYALQFQLWAGDQWNDATLAMRNSELAELEKNGIPNPKAESYPLDLSASSSAVQSLFATPFTSYSGSIHWAYDISSALAEAIRSGSYRDLTLGFLSPVVPDDTSKTYYCAFSFSQVSIA